MTTLFVGDVHGCADELSELLDGVSADRVLLLGDLFTKGPNPKGVWRLIQERGLESILGNQDEAVLKRADLGEGLVGEEALRWLAERPLSLAGDGWLAVHAGLDPWGGLAASSRQTLLNVRRWPNDAEDGNPFWWELYEGPPFVLFGHDARRGLVDRRPHGLGLDTGCVYGKALTGYLLEEDRLVQVAAKRTYWDPTARGRTPIPS